MTPKIELRLLDKRLLSEVALRPNRATEGSAAIDLRACLDEPLVLGSGDSRSVSSGIAVHIANPELCGIIAPRSGMGSKQGIVLANTVGIIDSDYTGEIKLMILNRGRDSFTIEPYARVCQMIFMPVIVPAFTVVSKFSSVSSRGTAGFGSTGTT